MYPFKYLTDLLLIIKPNDLSLKLIMTPLVEFSSSVFQLPVFGAVIQEFTAEGPDEYGDYKVSLKIAI